MSTEGLTVEQRLTRLEAILEAFVRSPGGQAIESAMEHQAAPFKGGVLEGAYERFKDRIRTEPARARGKE